MKVNSKIIWLMDMENTRILMVTNILENGLMMLNMGKEKKFSQMDLYSQESLIWAKRKDKGISNGKTVLLTKVNSTTIKWKEWEHTLILMAENMWASERIIACMVKVPLVGKMAENTLGSIKMTRNMAKVCLLGLTEKRMLVAGSLISNMESANKQARLELKRLDNGKMV